MAKRRFLISYIVYALHEANEFEQELREMIDEYDDNYELSIRAYNTVTNEDIDPLGSEAADPDEEETKYEVSAEVDFSKDVDYEKLGSELRDRYGHDLECSVED